jgi:carbonic anhydrase
MDVIRSNHDFDRKAFSAQPGYDEPRVRREFARLVPLRTIVIQCYDPRVAGIPAAVARDLGDEYPGELRTDAHGNPVGTTASLMPVVVAGGRAMDALRSITIAQHLFGVENVAVVHHTHCGATSFTTDGLIAAFESENGVDISTAYPRESMCISDYTSSLAHDVALIRRAPGTPRHVNVHGYVYDIDTGSLTRLILDRGAARARRQA